MLMHMHTSMHMRMHTKLYMHMSTHMHMLSTCTHVRARRRQRHVLVAL